MLQFLKHATLKNVDKVLNFKERLIFTGKICIFM